MTMFQKLGPKLTSWLRDPRCGGLIVIMKAVGLVVCRALRLQLFIFRMVVLASHTPLPQNELKCITRGHK